HADTMPHMPDLTEAQLAERAGVGTDRVTALLDLGIVAVQPDGTFLPGNVQRVRLANALERSGVALDAVATAIEKGELSFGFLNLLFDEDIAFTGKTYAQACAERGWDVSYVQQIHQALGLPRPEPEDPVRDDDLQMFATGEFSLGLGMTPDQVARALRVYGDNLRRITDAESPFYHAYFEEPLLRAGLSEGQMLETVSQMSPQIRD